MAGYLARIVARLGMESVEAYPEDAVMAAPDAPPIDVFDPFEMIAPDEDTLASEPAASPTASPPEMSPPVEPEPAPTVISPEMSAPVPPAEPPPVPSAPMPAQVVEPPPAILTERIVHVERETDRTEAQPDREVQPPPPPTPPPAPALTAEPLPTPERPEHAILTPLPGEESAPDPPFVQPPVEPTDASTPTRDDVITALAQPIEPPDEPPAPLPGADTGPTISIGDIVVEIVATRQPPEAPRRPAGPPRSRPPLVTLPRPGVRSKRGYGMGQG